MKTVVLVLAVSLVAGLAVRELFPRTERVVVPGPPSAPVIVTVSEDSAAMAQLRSTVERMEAVLRELRRQDTINLVDTVFVGDTVRVGLELKPRWYLDSLTVAQFFGETSLASGTRLWADTTGIYRLDETRTYFTPGPLLGATSDADGIHLSFGAFPEPEKPCKFWCKRGHELIGVAGGILLWELVR